MVDSRYKSVNFGPVDKEEDAVNIRERHPRVGDPAVLAQLPKVNHAHREVVVDQP